MDAVSFNPGQWPGIKNVIWAVICLGGTGVGILGLQQLRLTWTALQARKEKKLEKEAGPVEDANVKKIAEAVAGAFDVRDKINSMAEALVRIEHNQELIFGEQKSQGERIASLEGMTKKPGS